MLDPLSSKDFQSKTQKGKPTQCGKAVSHDNREGYEKGNGSVFSGKHRTLPHLGWKEADGDMMVNSIHQLDWAKECPDSWVCP
jgi:hypothetical protein